MSSKTFKHQSSPEDRALVRSLKGNLRNKNLVHDATCGLHSGFPPCCVAFYILVWELCWRWTDRSYNKTINKVAGTAHGVDYVPCPACLLKRNFVKVKTCHCYDWLRRATRKKR